MGDPLSRVIQTQVQRGIDFAFAAIGQEILTLLCYDRNFDDFDYEAQSLLDERKSLQILVDKAIGNGDQIYPHVKTWMERVDKMLEDIDEFKKNEDHSKAKCLICRFPNPCSRYLLSREAKNMSMAFAKILLEKPSQHQGISYPVPLQCIDTSSMQKVTGSRETIMIKILQSLKDSNEKILGVFGLPGVGKSFLAKQVAKEAKAAQICDVLVMVKLTQQMEVSKIQDAIAEILRLELTEKTELARAARLHQFLKTRKNVLIILDNLWERRDLNRVGIPFGDEHKSCKILLTSRSVEVLCNQIDCKRTFHIDCLPYEEAWSLFKKMVELVDDSNVEEEILNIAIEIQKRCSGLPLAIKAVATSLKGKGIEEWRDARRQIKSPTSRDLTKMVDSCIEWSYINLEKEELKCLFLLSACYGHTIIYVIDLLKYSVGLGLLEGTSTITEARDKLKTLLGKLKASCLLLEDDSSDYLVMHDVVRDVGISIATKERNQFTIRFDNLDDWPDKDQLQNYTAINLIYSNILCKLPKELFCPRLNFFHIGNKDPALRISDDFFKGVCELKVLDLTVMKFASGLPPSIAYLSNLQSLSLDYCILQDVEVIGYLKTLKVLSFVSSVIKILPQSFRNLSELQLLDLSDCSKLHDISRNVTSAWKKLEELLMKNISVQWEFEGCNASLTELNHLSMLKTLEIHIRDVSMPTTRELMFQDLMRYIILIGDGWDWSRKSKALRTLKIKLKVTHYLQKWVKCLLKYVEDLYLDELCGVTNVVDELNEDGFPYLKHIHVQNNIKIQYIVEEWFRSFQVFPRLESLILDNLINLIKICHAQVIGASFSKLQVVKVKNCHALRNVLPSSLVRQLSQLKEIEVSKCNLVEHIFAGEEIIFDSLEFDQLQSLKIKHLPKLLGFSPDDNTKEYYRGGSLYRSQVDDGLSLPVFSVKVSFPNLETLELASIKFQKIWQDGHSASSCVQSLTSLTVDGCIYMKYLFSLPVIRCLLKLRHLKISSCPTMEAIIQLEDMTNIHDSQEAWFPSLETLKMSNMNILRTVWSEHVAANAYPKLKTIEIEKCLELRNVIPSCMLIRLKSLEALIVSDCSSLREVFTVDANCIAKVFNLDGMKGEVSPAATLTQLRSLTLSCLPKLKNVWSKDPKGILKFESLQKISVASCPELKNLFPLSLARGLLQLEELDVQYFGVEEIVRLETDLQESVHFVFPRLRRFQMCYLDKLKYFYPGSYTVKWPHLMDLSLLIMSEVKIFESKHRELQVTDTKEEFENSKESALFLIEEVVPNLKTLALNGKSSVTEWFKRIPNNFLHRLEVFIFYGLYEEYITFPQWILQKLPPLQFLLLRYSSFEEGFPSVASATDDEQTQMIRDVKFFGLQCLPKLEVICKEGCRLPVLENLEKMWVVECSSLVKLVPSSVLFNNMKHLKIKKCNGLKTLITLSTAKSLVHLSVLSITECTMIEEVVVSDGQNKENEIEFRELQVLKFKSLPRLKCFWSINVALTCPKLCQVTINGCPRMTTFIGGALTTPELQEVRIERDGDELYWEGDLNTTIERIFNREVKFCQLNYLELQEFPELKEIWHSRLPDRAFCNIRELVVEKCDFLSSVISDNLLLKLKSLEELQVGNCDNVEAVFDLEGNDGTDGLKIQESFNLRVIALNHLPRLKQVWKADPEYFSRFHKLQMVKLTNCHNLDYLFPCTMAEHLQDLEELEIESCNKMEEIIAKEDVSAVVVKDFIFPNVTSIRLTELPKLKNFYTVQWPLLRSIYTLACDKLAIFTTELESSHETSHLENQSTETQIPLFSFEKVIPNVQELSLERRDATRIWQGEVAADLVGGLHFLRLQSFNENDIFPCRYLQKMNSLKGLVVKYSSFKEIFRSEMLDEKEGEAGKEGLPRLEELHLLVLPRLEYICKEDFALHPMLEILKKLNVEDCPLLTNIVPSSVSFTHLKYLEVSKCHGLISLLTFRTARSIVQLEEIIVDDCEMVQEIVAINDNEGEYEILLKKLKNLELKSLPCLENFCSKSCNFVLPRLIKVTVTKCPRMKVFSHGTTTTPKLQRVKVEDADRYCWGGDLNASIKDMVKDLPVCHFNPP